KLASNRQYYGERDHHGESMTNQELDHQRSSSGIPPLAATPVPAALAVALVVVLGGTAYTATLTAVGGLPAATVAPVLAALVVAPALARFGGRERRSPDVIFGEALAVGLGVELELAALETGLTALGHLPPGSYLSLNVSPSTVLSARLAQVLDGAEAARIVL